ncbi:MAG: arginase family protein, partial [Fibrella sp.]|nr:arginase family protein [Armatimonadota bacterium]
PLMQEQDTVVFAYRDGEEAQRGGSKDVAETAIRSYGLSQARQQGVAEAATEALRHLTARASDTALRGFWFHFDADVLDDAVMPAVDYRLPGGLSLEEASEVLQMAHRTGQMLGVTVTIFNPTLDSSGDAARALTACLLAGLRNG